MAEDPDRGGCEAVLAAITARLERTDECLAASRRRLAASRAALERASHVVAGALSAAEEAKRQAKGGWARAGRGDAEEARCPDGGRPSRILG